MDFLELAKRRYSCRSYTDQPVEQDKIDRIVEAAHVAPTAANRQPVRLLLVDDAKGLEALDGAGMTHGAPLAIVVCADRTQSWHRKIDDMNAADIDATILTDHMMMEATALGLGTCWICWFDPKAVKRDLALPEALDPVNILVVGYADDEPASPDRHAEKRIPLSELVLNA